MGWSAITDAGCFGDHGRSAPEHWAWGGPKQEKPPLHGVLLLYARDEDELRVHRDTSLAALSSRGVRALGPRLETTWLPDFKEHFGFRDGIGQPAVLGIHAQERADHVIAAGEILLGHRNEYGRLPRSPHVILPSPHLPDSRGVDGRDFGRDGSYLVIRQLEQDVPAFWEAVTDRAEELRIGEVFPGCGSSAAMLASKLVGRWPSGAPLVLHPERDPGVPSEEDAFGYATRDPHGEKCPLGAHIRRSNPRDWFLGDTPAESTRIANRHRILRRGRAYGPPLSPTMQVEDLQKAEPDHRSRGLLFVCLNANIGRQFEFVQHSWLNAPKFGGLHSTTDPLLGDDTPAAGARASTNTFEIPAHPLRLRATPMHRFAHTRGGAYFFLPSLRALRYLASG